MEISENKLIGKIKRFERNDRHIIRGIGDDGAVVTMGKGEYVFVQDAMVEHVHFEFSFLDAYFVGKKIVDVNVSDILSMGAWPLYYLVTIGIPGKTSSRDIERLYKGMRDASREFGLALLGGDTVKSDTFFVDLSMIGKMIAKKGYLGRDKARIGDLIAVTGYLGESAYGLHLLQTGRRGAGSKRFLKRFQDPDLPWKLWEKLIKEETTQSMMDISDGLIIDLERMMQESHKGAKVLLDAIPAPPILRKKGLEELALTGGEDYQLLFTFPPEKLSVIRRFRDQGHMITIIGEVIRGKGVHIMKNGREVYLSSKGYQHFEESHA